MGKKNAKPKEAPDIGGVPFKELVGALVQVPVREGKKRRSESNKKKKK